jgi:hypothetical protein
MHLLALNCYNVRRPDHIHEQAASPLFHEKFSHASQLLHPVHTVCICQQSRFARAEHMLSLLAFTCYPASPAGVTLAVSGLL